jgi:hypothetical protein
VRDAEAIRAVLVPPDAPGGGCWTLLGQSFGGFCAVHTPPICSRGPGLSTHHEAAPGAGLSTHPLAVPGGFLSHSGLGQSGLAGPPLMRAGFSCMPQSTGAC